jgi:hypothetical protein
MRRLSKSVHDNCVRLCALDSQQPGRDSASELARGSKRRCCHRIHAASHRVSQVTLYCNRSHERETCSLNVWPVWIHVMTSATGTVLVPLVVWHQLCQCTQSDRSCLTNKEIVDRLNRVVITVPVQSCNLHRLQELLARSVLMTPAV